MLKIDQEFIITELFRLGMIWRIVYGAIRLVLGLILLKIVGSPISTLVQKIMSPEITEDPTDILYQVVNALMSHSAPQVTYFLAFYFIFWGFLDIFLSVYLLREKLWAFPVSLALIGTFVIYELIRFTHTHSLILLSVVFIDVLIMALILKEWRLIKKSHL